MLPGMFANEVGHSFSRNSNLALDVLDTEDRVLGAPRLPCQSTLALTSARSFCAVPDQLTARRSTPARSANQQLTSLLLTRSWTKA